MFGALDPYISGLSKIESIQVRTARETPFTSFPPTRRLPCLISVQHLVASETVLDSVNIGNAYSLYRRDFPDTCSLVITLGMPQSGRPISVLVAVLTRTSRLTEGLDQFRSKRAPATSGERGPIRAQSSYLAFVEIGHKSGYWVSKDILVTIYGRCEQFLLKIAFSG